MPVIDAIDIDYEQVQKEAYYLAQCICDRFIELITITYESKAKAGRELGINSSLLSRYNYVKRLNNLLLLAKKADMNLFYLLEGMSRYKYESWVNMTTNCWNLINHYKNNVYRYKMPKSLHVVMSHLNTGKNTNLSLTTLYSFSIIFKKPVWWLIQDERQVIVNPELRVLNGKGGICHI